MQLRDLTPRIRTFSGVNVFRYGMLGGLLLLGLFCLAGGASEAAKTKALNYELSREARRVSSLLDRGAYGAAQGILDAKLPQHPDDAGLHVQYARWLVLSRSPSAPNFVQTPLYPVPNAYWAPSVAVEAGRRAVQLDPDAKAYAAAVLMTSLHEKVAAALENGNGVIGDGVFERGGNSIGFLDGFQASSLKVGWTALELDPQTAAAFRDDFRSLVEQAVMLGKVASAAMLGKLVGDLENGGHDGTRDFDLACDAFARALANAELPKQPKDPGVMDWVQKTVKIFCSGIFQAELDAVAKGAAPESYRRLEKILNERGYAIVETAEFQQAMKERESARREAEERVRKAALAPRIAEAKEKFAAAVFDESQRGQHSADSFRQEDGFFQHRLDAAINGSGFAFANPSSDGFKAERQLRAMQAFPSDLRDDLRIGWVLSHGKRAIEYWSTKTRYGAGPPTPTRTYAEKMERYLAPVVVHRRVFSDTRGFDESRTESLTAGADELIRYDTEVGKYLVRAAQLPAARLAAAGRWHGPFWMTTLAEISLAVEKREAIVFDERGRPLRLGKEGLVGYLLSLEVEEPDEDLRDPSNRIQGPKPPVDFKERFPQYVAAVRAGRDPAAGLDAAERENDETLTRPSQRRRRSP